MRIIEKQVFSFNELNEETQDKIIEKFYDINIYCDWHEFTVEAFQNVLNILGIDCTSEDIHFSGFSSQGDGLNFSGRYSYKKKSMEKIKKEYPWIYEKISGDIKVLNAIQKRYFYSLSCRIVLSKYFRYCHSNAMSIDYIEILGENEPKNYTELKENLQDIFRSIAEEFYFLLNREYDYLTSREQIIETIEANEYEFDDRGNL
jgi:hypothetical protein